MQFYWITRFVVFVFFFLEILDQIPIFFYFIFFLQRTKEPAAREPAVLSTMASIVNKLEGTITPEVLVIFNAVFECTLDMINKNFEDYPVHRTNFYEMLQAVNTHCFKAFLNLPPAQFKLVFDSIVWAFKHTMRNVADTGLQILYQVSEFH
jgi:exportin-1